MAKPLILVVEADSKERAVLTSYLENYRVFEAGCYSEAEQIVRLHFLKLRVILCNYSIKGSFSHSFIESISKISSVPRVVVYSEKRPVGEVVSVIKSGAYDYMVEPLSADTVQRVVSSSIDALSYVESEDEIDVFMQMGLQGREAHNLQMARLHREGKTVNTEDMLTMCPRLDDQSNMNINLFGKELFQFSEVGLKSLRKAKILIVEDESVYRLMLTQLLSDRYDIYEAGTGSESLDVLKEEEDIDVIILDIFLPDVTGDELISHIRSLNKRAEIIVLTAYERVDKAVNSLKFGAFEYINKPVLKVDLLDAVSRALDQRYKHSILPEFSKKFLLNMLSDDIKVTMLERHCRLKYENKVSVLMKDIYLFFPELKDTYIPDSLTVPKRVIESDIRKFVEDLQKQAVSIN